MSLESFLLRGRGLSIDNVVGNWNSDVTEATKVEVHLLNALLHPCDKGIQITETIAVGLAALNASEWKDTVVQYPSDVSWFCTGGRTRKDLSNKVGSEGRKLIHEICLSEKVIRCQRNDGYDTDLIFGYMIGGQRTVGGQASKIHSNIN